jgi:hypothetical protein
VGVVVFSLCSVYCELVSAHVAEVLAAPTMDELAPTPQLHSFLAMRTGHSFVFELLLYRP